MDSETKTSASSPAPDAPPQEGLTDLIDRLEARARIEDPAGYDREDAPPDISWPEMAQIAALLREAAAALKAASPSQEAGTIQSVKDHWFIQGGKMQFGMIDGENADEVIASILHVVRKQLQPPLAASSPASEEAQ